MLSQSRKKIAIYCDCNSKGGVWVYTVKMAKMFTEHGCEVYVLTHSPRSVLERELYNELAAYSSYIQCFPREDEKVMIETAKEMASFMLNAGVDIYFPNYRDVSFLALHLLDKIFTVAVCHNNHESYYKKIRRYDSVLNAVVFPNKSALADCKKAIAAHNAHYCYIPHYLDIDCGELIEKDIYHLKLIYFGRIEREQKEIFELVKIAKEIRNSNISFEMVAIGNGTDKDAFAKLVNEAGFAGQIKIFDAMQWEQLVPHIQKAHFSLLTSTYEGFCYSAAESMALGTPLACYENTAVTDYLVNDVNGIMVKWGDAKSLVQRVAGVLAAGSYPLMQKQAAAYIATNFSVAHVNAEYSKLLQETELNPRIKRWPLLRPKAEPAQKDILGRVAEKLGLVIGVWK